MPTGVWGLIQPRRDVMDIRKKAVLVDIDGTLVTVTDFDYEVLKTGDQSVISEYLKFWDAETMKSSALIGGIELLKKFKSEGYVLVFLTARGQGCRVYTKKKLKEIGVWEMVDSIWHRPARYEGVSSSVYKEAMIKMLMKKWDFEWAMDDEDKNLVVMEKMGMKVIDAKAWW